MEGGGGGLVGRDLRYPGVAQVRGGLCEEENEQSVSHWAETFGMRNNNVVFVVFPPYVFFCQKVSPKVPSSQKGKREMGVSKRDR